MGWQNGHVDWTEDNGDADWTGGRGCGLDWGDKDADWTEDGDEDWTEGKKVIGQEGNKDADLAGKTGILIGQGERGC